MDWMAILSWLQPYVEMLLEKYGPAAQVIEWLMAALGTWRVVFKPLRDFLGAVVKATATQKDDEFFEKIERSPIIKGIAYVLDWLFSIKLPAKKVAVEAPPEGDKAA